MKILDSIYIPFKGRSFGGGIICLENEIGQRSCRVGLYPTDMNDKDSQEWIMHFGSKLTFKQSLGFFPELITEGNFKYK
jgi:hypothetical protein